MAILGRGPAYPTPDLPEAQPGILAEAIQPTALGKPGALGIILDVLAAAGGARPMYQTRRHEAEQQQQMFQKGMLERQLEEAAWQRREEYKRAHPSPFRFEANNGDQMEIGEDGQPRTLFKDPTPKIDWIQVKDPATGAISIVPRPQGGVPQGPPPGVTFKPRAGGAGSQAPRTFPGQIAPGNIDIHNRPIVRNRDGSISTVRTISIGIDQGEVLIPTVIGNRVVSDDEAVREYRRTGKHLGIFRTPDEATAYAKSLHDEQAQEYLPQSRRMSSGDVMPHLIQQESGGRAGIRGPVTPYGQAMGLTQVLPATGQGLARKLGVPWREDLMTGTTPDAAEYQRRIGQAYLEEGLNATGNVRDALRYYHGGPNRRQWGPKTNRYADTILSRMGNR